MQKGRARVYSCRNGFLEKSRFSALRYALRRRRLRDELSHPPLTAGTIEISDPARNGTREPARISDILIADENVDVLANLSLLGGDAVAHAG